MAIQFPCVACSNTVEVDEAWGGRLVECPYCHETITAPAFAAHAPTEAMPTPPQEALAPPESPHSPPPFATPPIGAQTAYAGHQPPPQARSNKLAVVALVLAIASLTVGFAAFIAVITAMSNNLGTNPTEAEARDYAQEAFESGAPWIIKAGFGLTGSCGLWLAGLVCAIIAVCRPVRRGLAIAALVVLALPLLFGLVGMLLPA